MVDPAARLSNALASRYVIERELGAGGMATVYLSSDVKHGRMVAVKLLRPELAAALGRDRFLREIDTLGKLTHPHILPLHDSGTVDDDLCYFVMPYVEGESLRARLDREGQLPIDDAIRFAYEIADALDYAHGRGVIHRDIKPSNVMIEAGHAVLTDFGIALSTDGKRDERLTVAGHSLGTPEYMSPEQASSDKRIDGRADIYSLGCVLYEMLVGNPPFTGSNAYGILARHAVEPPPPIRVVRDTVSESLERICFRALAKSPADRWATAKDFIAELSGERMRRSYPVPTTAPVHAGEGRDEPGRINTSTAAFEGARETAPRPGELALRFGPPALAAAMTLTLLGYLNVAVHDSQLHMPDAHTPSEANYLAVGVRSLVLPSLAVAVVAIVLVSFCLLAAMAFRLCERLPVVGAPFCDLRVRLSAWSERIRDTTDPTATANLLLIGTLVAGGAALAYAAPFLAAVFSSDTTVIGCESRFARWGYQPILGGTLATLTAVRFGVLRWVRRRQGGLTGVAAARFGTAVIIFLILVAASVPWKLVIAPGKERVRIGDDRAYILRETPDELLLYNASRGATVTLPKSDRSAYVRLGIRGYVFEEPEVFASGRNRCDAVYERYR